MLDDDNNTNNNNNNTEKKKIEDPSPPGPGWGVSRAGNLLFAASSVAGAILAASSYT